MPVNPNVPRLVSGVAPGADPANYWETDGALGDYFWGDPINPPDAPSLRRIHGPLESVDTSQFAQTAPALPEFDMEEFYNALGRQEGMYNELNPFYTERMDPNWSMFGPEARGALERRIGNQLAVAQSGITGDLRRRGIYGSGIEAQLEMDAQNIASGATADMYGQMALADEMARERAATGLEGMRQFGARGLGDLGYEMADQGPEMAQMFGQMMAVGPVFERLSALGIYDTNEAIALLEEEKAAAIAEGTWKWQDTREIALGMLYNGVNPLEFGGRVGALLTSPFGG